MPKVSVIIPVYGVEPYIERCVRSLFEQTLDDIEYLFIDDCTPDHSIEILRHVLEEYPQRKPQVTIHRMERNSGQAKVREWGIKNATGEYVIHCDSDDWVDSTMYEILYNEACNSMSDLVICNYYISDGVGNSRIFNKRIVDTSRDVIFQKLLTSYDLNPVWSALAHRSLYGRVTCPTGNQGEDKTYMIQLCYYSKKISYCAIPLYYYRIRQSSISHQKGVDAIIKRYNQIQENNEIIYRFAHKEQLFDKYKDAFQVYFVKSKFLMGKYIADNRCKVIWKGAFPMFNKGVLWNPMLSIREKFSYYMILLRSRV